MLVKKTKFFNLYINSNYPNTVQSVSWIQNDLEILIYGKHFCLYSKHWRKMIDDDHLKTMTLTL